MSAEEVSEREDDCRCACYSRGYDNGRVAEGTNCYEHEKHWKAKLAIAVEALRYMRMWVNEADCHVCRIEGAVCSACNAVTRTDKVLARIEGSENADA